MKSKNSKKTVLLNAENAKAKLPYVSDCPVCALDNSLGSDIVVGIDLPVSPWTVTCVSCCNSGPAALSPELAVKKWNEYCEVTMKQMAKLPVPVDCPQCGSAVTCIYPKGNKWQIACKSDCLKGPLAETPQLALEAWGIKY